MANKFVSSPIEGRREHKARFGYRKRLGTTETPSAQKVVASFSPLIIPLPFSVVKKNRLTKRNAKRPKKAQNERTCVRFCRTSSTFCVFGRTIFGAFLDKRAFCLYNGRENKREHRRLFPVEQSFALAGCRADGRLSDNKFSLPCVKGGAELWRGGGIVKVEFAQKQSLTRLCRELPLHKGAFHKIRTTKFF